MDVSSSWPNKTRQIFVVPGRTSRATRVVVLFGIPLWMREVVDVVIYAEFGEVELDGGVGCGGEDGVFKSVAGGVDASGCGGVSWEGESSAAGDGRMKKRGWLMC